MGPAQSEGDTVGSYRIVRPVDPAGGMDTHAAVAIQTSGERKGRLVIIKRVEARGPRARRALRELAEVKRLRHRAVAQVIEHFEHDRQLVVVFDHDFDGPRLDQIQMHLQRQGERLADGAILFLGHQLMHALAEAHELVPEGETTCLVHGHLGPDRVQISWDGAVRLVGLGVPSLFDDAGRSPLALAYRPPEQRATRIGGPAGDVFSVSALLWALFTGRRPPATDKPFPKLAHMRKDIPEAVVAAIDKGLVRNPALRRITCRELATTLETHVRGIADPTELKWNMEVFRALSLFAGSQPPKDSLPPVGSDPPPDDDWLPPPIPSRPSGAGPRSHLEWLGGKKPAPGKKGKEDDSVIQRLTDLFDALPLEAAEPRSQKERASVDAGWDLDEANEVAPPAERADPKATLKSAREASSTAPPTEQEALTIPSGDSAPPTEPDPPTEPSIDEQTRPTRAEPRIAPPARLPSPPIETPRISTKTSPAPVSSEPTPSTEPEPGRLAAPPPSMETYRRQRDEAAEAVPPVVVKRGAPATTVVAIAIGCLGVGFGIAWELKPNGAPIPSAPPLSVAPSTAAPKPTTPVAEPPPSPSPAAPPEPSATASAAPSASASASAEASAAPDASAPPDPDASPADGTLPPLPTGGRDGAKLLSYEGYLIVRSPSNAEVFVQGIQVGNTNSELLTRCRQRNVRLRDAESGRWITPGQSVQIACMATTTVTITPH